MMKAKSVGGYSSRDTNQRRNKKISVHKKERKMDFMKKVLCMVVALMLFVCSACADFSIRGGIGWGSTKEDVLRIQESNGIGENQVSESDERLIYKPINIAGVEKSYLRYDFSQNQQGDQVLTQIFYELGGLLTRPMSDTIYSKMYESIVLKYGDPIHEKDGKHVPYHSQRMDSYQHNSFMYQIHNYGEWLIKSDDETHYTLIEICQATQITGDSFVHVDFMPIYADDIEEALKPTDDF